MRTGTALRQLRRNAFPLLQTFLSDQWPGSLLFDSCAPLSDCIDRQQDGSARTYAAAHTVAHLRCRADAAGSIGACTARSLTDAHCGAHRRGPTLGAFNPQFTERCVVARTVAL